MRGRGMGYTYTARKLENSKKGGGCKRSEWEMVDYGGEGGEGDGGELSTVTWLFRPRAMVARSYLYEKGKGQQGKKKTLNAE